MIVCYRLQGRDLSLKCAFLCQRCGDLIVVQAVSLLSDEVYFRIADFSKLENVSVDASKYEIGDLEWVHVTIGSFKSFLLAITMEVVETINPIWMSSASVLIADSSLLSFLPDSLALLLHLALC